MIQSLVALPDMTGGVMIVNAALLAAVFQRLGDVQSSIRFLETRMKRLEELSHRTLSGG